MGGLMSEATISLPQFGPRETILLWIVLCCSVIALGYGLYLRRLVLRRDPGPDSMVRVATAIQEGAMAYLRRQLRTMLPFIAVVTAGLYLLYAPIYAQHPVLAVGVAGAFLLGCFASYGAGFVGMTSAVHGNVRVANAARRSYREALRTGFQAGTISGMFTVGLGLLGATIIFMAFKENAMRVPVGFGFGGCGVAGAGAFALKLIIYPLLVRAIGVFASLVGTWVVRGKDEAIGDPMQPINIGFWTAAGISAVGFGLVSLVYLRDPVTGDLGWRFGLATLVGIGLAVVIGRLTELFTHPDRAAVSEIAYSAKTGPATLLLTGLGSGLESTVWSILAIAVTLFASYQIFGGSVALAAYGIALAGLGLLTTTGFILAEDTFGPIVDNANGIFEMSGVEHGESQAGRIVARLDQIGNTTKALTKGFAIATAVVAAIALFRSFIDEARLFVTIQELVGAGAQQAGAMLSRVGIQVNLPLIFIGLLIGGAVPFLVSAFLIRAVGRSAFLVVEEVRRQFREIPGLLQGKARPDYSRCVDIVTKAAQRELLGPGLIGIAAPVLVGFGLGAGALGAYLAGAILTAQLLAVFMANTGGAWDNAKKKIEDGYLGGKGTDAHKAGVIGDTVGDPLKDTAGPALNPLIKVMNLVAILIAPVVIQPLTVAVRLTVVGVALLLVAVAVAISRRTSITEEPVRPRDARPPKETAGKRRN